MDDSMSRRTFLAASALAAACAVAACGGASAAEHPPSTASPAAAQPTAAALSTAAASPPPAIRSTAASAPIPRPRVSITRMRTADGALVTIATFLGPVRYVLHNGSADPGPAASGLVRAGPAVTGAERRQLLAALPADLAAALAAHGARVAMELGINPEWVQLDAARIPGGTLTAEIPGQYRPSGQYLAGWTRDFFTVLAPSASPAGTPPPAARIRP